MTIIQILVLIGIWVWVILLVKWSVSDWLTRRAANRRDNRLNSLRSRPFQPLHGQRRGSKPPKRWDR
jgi:hypothetical protein